jgi:hypothetical protein
MMRRGNDAAGKGGDGRHNDAQDGTAAAKICVDGPSEEDLIARNLRKLFRTCEAEPLPERFRTLLDRLADVTPLERGRQNSSDRSEGDGS